MTSEIITIIANISFVVSIIFFFFSAIQLVNKSKPLSNYFLSVIFFAVGLQYLSFWLYFRNSPLFEKYFYYSDTAFLFLIGSFLYLFFLYITTDTPIILKTWLHSVPFLAALIIIEGLNLYYPVLDDKTGLLFFDLITSLSYLSLFIYLILILRTLYSYYRNNNNSPEIKNLIYIIICSLIFAFILLLSTTLWPKLQYISHIAFLCIPLSFIIFLIRYPAYLSKAQKESQVIRYRNSQIAGLDKGKLVAQIDRLMGQEKIYLDRTLDLKTLSSKLKISSSQLSELLNSHYRTNFNSFLNSYRIEEAKIILNRESDVHILETAFDCGFNSKSTFNTAFKKFTGMTPSEYKNSLFIKKVRIYNFGRYVLNFPIVSLLVNNHRRLKMKKQICLFL